MLSRSTFLHGSAALAGLGATTTTAAACGAEEVPDAGTAATEKDSSFGPVPAEACPRIERMPPITGPGVTDRFRMAATDLGAPAVAPDGRILFVFGDTFEEPVVGGGFWRSPVGLFADPDHPLDEGISWTSAVGGEIAEQLVPYEHDEDPVSTILPGDVLTVGETMYLWMMVNHGFGTVAGTEIWTSEDSGKSWERTAEMFPGDHAGGLMQQCTWSTHPEDGFVYLLTTGFQRDKGVILSRVEAGSILDPERVRDLQRRRHLGRRRGHRAGRRDRRDVPAARGGPVGPHLFRRRELPGGHPRRRLPHRDRGRDTLDPAARRRLGRGGARRRRPAVRALHRPRLHARGHAPGVLAVAHRSRTGRITSSSSASRTPWDGAAGRAEPPRSALKLPWTVCSAQAVPERERLPRAVGRGDRDRELPAEVHVARERTRPPPGGCSRSCRRRPSTPRPRPRAPRRRDCAARHAPQGRLPRRASRPSRPARRGW